MQEEATMVPQPCHADAPRRAGRPIWKGFLLLASACVSSSPAVAASASSPSNHRYDPYRYDMTTPQFTPDGRLLQVEYATASAANSLPLVVVQYSGSSVAAAAEKADAPATTTTTTTAAGAVTTAATATHPFCLVVAARRRTATTRRSSGSGSSSSSRTGLGAGGESSAFERLLLLPVSSLTGIDHDGSGTAVLGMSGVLSDCLLLLRSVQNNMRRHSEETGRPCTARQLAAALAGLCHGHAFGGGIRPFGATVVLCGLEEEEEEEEEEASTSASSSESLPDPMMMTRPRSVETVRVWQTDPSGALRQLPSGLPSSDSNDKMVQIHVVGGSDAMQSSLRRKLRDRLLAADDSCGDLEIGRALRIVLDVLRKELDPPRTTTKNDVADGNGANDSGPHPETDSTLDLEAVVISPDHGEPYKLTPAQVGKLLASLTAAG